ncbi:DUF3526 domain-containing protein [Exilibacterium tricleocarpae]|uniref:DUF3526 domain-containing protein n=1 Tax=Exilibacterium tricleocarpae TaxID=2591008 RepID=UPI0015D26EED|nr:DUF3526 domain-containing protein [Exilibacterium tricleocarpae]
MIFSLTTLEIRLFIKSWASIGLVVAMTALCVFALLSGSANHRANIEGKAEFLEAESARTTAFRQSLERLATGEDASNFEGRPMLIRDSAVLPEASLGDFAIGSDALYPSRVTVRLWENSASLFTNYQFENPTLLNLGRLDVTTVIVVILPLFMIAIAFDILATDRRSGRMRLLLTSGADARVILFIRLAVRHGVLLASLLIATTAAIWINTGDASLAERMTAYWPWLTGVILYAVFWSAVTGAVAWRNETSGQTASQLIALWALFVLVVPAIAVLVVQTLYPTPSRLAYLTEVRATASTADDGADGWIEAYQLDNPDQQIEQDESNTPYRSGYLRTVMVEQATAPMIKTFEATEDQRRSTLEWLRFLSPSLAAEAHLTQMAGRDTNRYRAFQRLARQQLHDLSARLGPKVLAGERISLVEYDALPRLQSSLDERFSKSVAQPRSLLILALYSLLAIALVALALRRKRLSVLR